VNGVTEFEATLKNWATSAASVRGVWIFGSVAKGSGEPRDLDVAVELADAEPFQLWMSHVADWRRELQAQLPIKLQLEWFDPDGATPTIAAGLAEAKRLVYERAS